MAASLNKFCNSANDALFDLFDGAVIMCGGFGLSGNAENCIDAIAQSGAKNLTIISNNCGNQGLGLAILLRTQQVKKVICSFIGNNPDLEDRLLSGEVQVELCPQGTLAERIRAGGVGIGAFYTPTGVGTIIAEHKEQRRFNNKDMILETALKADFTIIRAHVADTYGNLRFYRTSQNFSKAMAMAAERTIVEAENIVDFGAIDPDDVHLPGIFVNRVFKAENLQNPIEHRKVRA